MKKESEKSGLGFMRYLFFLASAVFLAGVLYSVGVFAVPLAASDIDIIANETINSSSGGSIVNISGGYIATLNVTAITQNPRWKGFVGNVTGSFTLDDASGSSLYDWASTSVSGEVYATRNASGVSWTNVNCSNVTLMEQENYRMNHSNSADNITSTFDGTDNSEFYIGSFRIVANSCPTTNTYVNSVAPGADQFEEVVLYESIGGNTIFATIMETDESGFDNQRYDFQMIVPEVGYTGFGGATAYYLFVELS